MVWRVKGIPFTFGQKTVFFGESSNPVTVRFSSFCAPVGAGKFCVF